MVFKQDNGNEFKESTIYRGINQFREMSKDCGVPRSYRSREPSPHHI